VLLQQVRARRQCKASAPAPRSTDPGRRDASLHYIRASLSTSRPRATTCNPEPCRLEQINTPLLLLLTRHPLGRLHRVVREDDVRARAPEAHERLEHGGALVEPAALRGRL
jgi:hypothetical protein